MQAGKFILVSLQSISDACSDVEETECLQSSDAQEAFYLFIFTHTHTRLYPLVKIKVWSLFLPQVLWYGPLLYRYLVQVL